jgi:hypothetical protein
MKALILLLFSILPFFVSGQNSCARFHKGNFSVKGENCISIKRTLKRQHEYNACDKIRSVYKIKWLDSCTYRLTMIRTTNKIKELIGVDMVHKIIRTDRGEYIYTTEYRYMSRDRCGAMGRYIRKEETIIKTD